MVLGVDAVVPKMGDGEGHDLSGVGRVGDDLLIARKHGVEDHLASGHAIRGDSTDGLSLKDLAVGQYEGGLHRPAPAVLSDPVHRIVHRWASASITTGLPARMVCRTRPRRVRPS